MVELKKGKMKAVRWEGKAFSVSVTDVEIPKIIDPLDAIVRLTSAAICGSDLHTYRGRFHMNHPLTFGHENLGIVEEVGEHVTTLKKGDRVLVNPGIAEVTDNGELGQGLPGEPISYGVGDYEPGAPVLDGGQAQFMRVPFANANLLVLPAGNEHELDYLLLADIWPTAWYTLECAGQVLGDTVVVFGAGPVGLLCAYSAILRGAIRVYSVDQVPERLAKAKSLGAIPINFRDSDPVAQILKLEPNGVDRACDCIGFEAVDGTGKNIENLIITQSLKVTRPLGGIGFIGVYVQEDQKPQKPDEATGVLPFPMGLWWAKGQTIRGGFAQIRLYQELLKNLIERGNANPSFVFSKDYRIEDAALAYKEFESHKIIKAVFKFDTAKKQDEV